MLFFVSTLMTSCTLGQVNAFAFGFDDTAARAKTLAESPYKKPNRTPPKELLDLSYDQYRDIRFKPQRAYWRNLDLPFELGFFHVGFQYVAPVKINEISKDGVHEIKFDPQLFDYGQNKLDPSKLGNVGYAGFRVHYPINTPKYKDEVLVFLGASYFRALGKEQLYGLSARGLAVDTAVVTGEEFPHFVEFWIERPAPAAEELSIYALLDSPRVTGAYRFVLKPGAETAMDVKVQLYLRTDVTKLGLAPLTSMFLFGENQRSEREDYRPEVHDSDGLSINAGDGEWIWRPLVNPKRLLVTSFATVSPIGFGVMQRDRRFSRYEDMESRYDMRPSVWVEPKGPWGTGRVELVQLPTPDETNDNVVAYWIPERAPVPKQPYTFEYRLLWQKESERSPPTSWVVQTRRGHGYIRKGDKSLAFIVDFDGPALRKLPPDATVRGAVSIDPNAELLENTVYRNTASGGWRLSLRFKRIDDTKPVELRGHLVGTNNQGLSETWSYILPPD
ncbi:MAG TPA: glucan biosynthesis protein G [Burkholderiales bacterium]|nr:glucan biosynthesis protein G [Burkholderiales bacterium]